jgi:hypothetical protein
MFKAVDFEVLQGRYVKAAMDKIATFRPEGKTPAAAQALIDAVTTSQATFNTKSATLALARGELQEKIDALHVLCTQVYPIMKVVYRTDAGSLRAINGLPIADRSQRETIGRGEGISSLWAVLPNPPGSATPFEAWTGMTRAAFDAVLTTAKTNHSGFANVDQDFQVAEGDLHKQTETLEDFTTGAIIIGRAQFLPGTPEREVIDAIPTEPASQPPEQPVISAASSPAAGTVHLEFDAERATEFDVLQKGAADPDFVVVAEDIIARDYDGMGLAPGSYDFKVVGRNSQGPGPESAVSTVVVT